MKAHIAFLNTYYTAGNFIISGIKVPRRGSIIIAQAINRKDNRARFFLQK